jgi:hypothetical protein
MAVEELLGWPYNSKLDPATRNIVLVDIDSSTTGGDVQTQFANAFTGIAANGWKVTIVSADPFFTQYADALVAAANQWVAPAGRRVCYPLNEYKQHGNPQKHTLHGPIITNEFGNLGTQVKNHTWTVVPATQLVEDH